MVIIKENNETRLKHWFWQNSRRYGDWKPFSKRKKKDIQYLTIVRSFVKLPLVDSETCEKNLKNTMLGPAYSLHTSFTCAGGEEGIDTCVGDGGSSLVCSVFNQDGAPRFAVYGMVAYGVGCGGKDEPGVYVNIPEMYSWVGQQMALNNFNKSYVY